MFMPGFSSSLDPRISILCVIAISIVVSCLTSLLAACASLALGIILLLCSGMNLRIAVSRLAVANAFIVFLWLIVPWTTPGTPIWQWRFITLTSSGLNLAMLVTLKANALICLFLAFVAPLPVTVLARAMGQLKCPPRLVWLFLLMDRNIHFLRQEWQHMSQAARLRGFYPRNSLHTYRTIASMLAFLLVRASNRGQRMLDAMRLRAFSGQLPYPAPKPVPARDYAFVVFALLFLVIICYLEFAYA